jgi:hypothetical protein
VTWGFLWLMVALKVPIAALLYLVWWAVRKPPEPAGAGDDGGSARPLPHRPHPRVPRSPRPRRGPHGAPALSPPPRVRSVTARARDLHHR